MFKVRKKQAFCKAKYWEWAEILLMLTLSPFICKCQQRGAINDQSIFYTSLACNKYVSCNLESYSISEIVTGKATRQYSVMSANSH